MNNKSRELDQFYTKPSVAKQCYKDLGDYINLNESFLIEPSAGSGSFSNLFHENSLSMDLDPKSENIKKCDYLSFDHSVEIKTSKKIIVLGNPPFGKNSSLAISFFNKSAKYADYIAFIVPKTFKKESVLNRLNLNYHLEYSKDIEKNGFIFNDKEYDVPCVFQIWKKQDIQRKKIISKKTTHLFDFTTKGNADIAVRRVGGLSGKVFEEFDIYKAPSHYYLKATNTTKEKLIKLLTDNYDEFQNAARNTAGNPSLSKSEMINIIEKSMS